MAQELDQLQGTHVRHHRPYHDDAIQSSATGGRGGQDGHACVDGRGQRHGDVFYSPCFGELIDYLCRPGLEQDHGGHSLHCERGSQQSLASLTRVVTRTTPRSDRSPPAPALGAQRTGGRDFPPARSPFLLTQRLPYGTKGPGGRCAGQLRRAGTGWRGHPGCPSPRGWLPRRASPVGTPGEASATLRRRLGQAFRVRRLAETADIRAHCRCGPDGLRSQRQVSQRPLAPQPRALVCPLKVCRIDRRGRLGAVDRRHAHLAGPVPVRDMV
ncbi:hypothetical protein BD413DRAFT_42949 [Trametes elegans]|nr:hypothetical protein BD413DRAFT_42949 [Trametes elegans]